MENDGKPNLRRALGAMLSHAANHSPYYKEQDWAARLRAGQSVAFAQVPITLKDDVKTRTALFFSAFVPPAEGEVKTKPTSGSTGEPMEVRKTARHYHFNSLENRRLKSGWGFGQHKLQAHISVPVPAHPMGLIEETDLPDGGHKWTLYTGESGAALDLLRRTKATFVMTSPSVMLAVLGHCKDRSETLPLKLVSTVAEIVPDELRELIREMPGCRLMDMYGTVETGLIAGQCPLCDAYHPADRHMILELLNDDGRKAGPGEMARVIVTTLFNRAMPLIRYETGDYAVVAATGGCPRSGVAIQRIIGRERNLFKLPDGRKVMPRLPHKVALDLAMRQFKLIQTTMADIELHYIPRDESVLIADDLAQDMVDRYMAPGFKVRCVRVNELPRAPSGKYLMHECLV